MRTGGFRVHECLKPPSELSHAKSQTTDEATHAWWLFGFARPRRSAREYEHGKWRAGMVEGGKGEGSMPGIVDSMIDRRGGLLREEDEKWVPDSIRSSMPATIQHASCFLPGK